MHKVKSVLKPLMLQWLCNSKIPCALQNQDLWEQVVCATNTSIIGAFISYFPKRNGGIKQNEDSELCPEIFYFELSWKELL